MMTKKTIVAILIVNYNGIDYLPECLQSLVAQAASDVDQRIFVVDNCSTDNSCEYLKNEWSQVTLIESDSNTGFAGGNNRGWNYIQENLPQADFIYLLNQDTIVAPGMFEPLIKAFEHDERVGAAQSLLLLHPQKTKINSLGNVIHFLGFGYSSHNGTEITKIHPRQSTINYASGAAVMLRPSAIQQVGLFDDFMFMYLEDLDLGWRLMLAGWKSIVVPESIVYHKYEFRRGMRQYYYFERNRLWIIFKNYRIATLLLLMPALVLMEAGQILFSILNRTFALKLKSYLFFFVYSNVRELRRDRAATQKLRVISDRACLRQFSGVIDFQPLKTVVLTRIANPLFNLYFWIIKQVVFW